MTFSPIKSYNHSTTGFKKSGGTSSKAILPFDAAFWVEFLGLRIQKLIKLACISGPVSTCAWKWWGMTGCLHVIGVYRVSQEHGSQALVSGVISAWNSSCATRLFYLRWSQMYQISAWHSSAAAMPPAHPLSWWALLWPSGTCTGLLELGDLYTVGVVSAATTSVGQVAGHRKIHSLQAILSDDSMSKSCLLSIRRKEELSSPRSGLCAWNMPSFTSLGRCVQFSQRAHSQVSSGDGLRTNSWILSASELGPAGRRRKRRTGCPNAKSTCWSVSGISAACYRTETMPRKIWHCLW